jgi:copper chaperone CopZ
MTCNHCQQKVEDALKAIPGVYAVFVDLEAGVADVDYTEGKATPDALAAAVSEVGYAATVAA